MTDRTGRSSVDGIRPRHGVVHPDTEEMTMTLPTTRTGGNDQTQQQQRRRWEPFSEFNQLTERLSRMLDEQASEFPLMATREGFVPMVDVEETDDAYVLDLELPGVKKEDINIEIQGKRLTVSGERKEEDRSGILRRRGRAWGRFSYEMTFPGEVDEGNVEASLDDGVLHLRVPKSTKAKSRHIEVR
jgi:HSP20 family protein